MNLEALINTYDSKDSFFKAVEWAIRKLAAENPDFVYKPTEVKGGCKYNSGPVDQHTGKLIPEYESEGCIFGQGLKSLGWDDPRELNIICPIGYLIYGCPSPWRHVQKAQDKGITWGEAILRLDEDFEDDE